MAIKKLALCHKSHVVSVVLIVTIWGLVAFGVLGHWLESMLLTHMLLEYPLLVAIGALLANCFRNRLSPWWQLWNGGGIAGILIASFTLAFWMIPRWLDASISEPFVAAAKHLSLPLLVGLPLAMSWPRLHSIAQGLVKIEFLTMLLRLGWLYLISPVRLCNNYLLNEQVWLGQGFLLIALALAITWLIPVFFGSCTDASASSMSKKLGAAD
mgnify:FL=1|jgi:hypothetical protein|tara:strand:- start:2233 stop:2868 length:636 start_codon:yes stop_codon:yes gene_type:complete